MRVLVAGATGLLGAQVAAALDERGHEVHRCARHVTPSDRSHRLDLRDRVATTELIGVVQPEVVIQMTGGAGADPVAMTESNVVPTMNLIDAVADRDGIKGLFITGSAAEYGDPGDAPATEDSPLRPLSPYGWVKLVEVAAATDIARAREVPMTVVRPFNPVSPQLPASTALGNFRRQLLDQEGSPRDIVCGRVDVVRDFVTTRFIAAAIAELAASPPGGVVNICSGVGLSLEQVMRAAAGIVGVELNFDIDADLAGIPAPSQILGDPTRLFSLVEVRPETSPDALAVSLLGLEV